MSTTLAIEIPTNTRGISIIAICLINIGTIGDLCRPTDTYIDTPDCVDSLWDVLEVYFIDRLSSLLSSDEKITVDTPISLSSVVFS